MFREKFGYTIYRQYIGYSKFSQIYSFQSDVVPASALKLCKFWDYDAHENAPGKLRIIKIIQRVQSKDF